MPGVLEHTLRLPGGLLESRTVIDVGCGVRPFSWWTPLVHICLEPSEAYCHVLQETGRYHIVNALAQDALPFLGAETVLLLDVIEHMEKAAGMRVIDLARQAASKQVVVYTPLGFQAQDTDNWGYGEHELQRHKSGWTPEDFPGWRIDLGTQSFFAIWTHDA